MFLAWMLWLSVGGSAVFGQVRGDKELRLTLDECVSIALDQNTAVVQAKLTRDFDDYGVTLQANNFIPRVSTSYGFSRNLIGPRDRMFLDTETGLVVSSPGETSTSGNQNVGGNINLNIFNVANIYGLSASRNNHKASLMALENSKLNVVFDVKRQYFELLKAVSLYEVQQEQIRVSEESLRRSETLNEIGSAPISEVFSARAELERQRVTLITRENNVEVARLNLGFELGLGTDVTIVPTQTEFTVDSDRADVAEALNQSADHPGLLADRLDMQAAKASMRANQAAARLPTLNVNSSYTFDLSKDENFRGLSDLWERNYRYGVRASVNFPLFNSNNAATNAKRQKINYLRSQETYEQAKRTYALDVKQSVLNIERLRRNIAASEESVKATEQDFRLQDERYNFGAGTFLERQQAQLNLFNQRSGLVQAKYDYQIERANYERLTGVGADEALVRKMAK